VAFFRPRLQVRLLLRLAHWIEARTALIRNGIERGNGDSILQIEEGLARILVRAS